MPDCATTRVIPAGDPSNPTGADVHFANQLHEAVDLAAWVGDCVFAAYSGRAVDVEADPGAARGNLTIDHHPEGLGFVTKYNHVTDVAVGAGEFVQKGSPLAAISSEPAEPHLHFELWAVVDRDTSADADWPGDTDLVPLDPTRALYAWEQRTAADEELTGGPLVPRSVDLLHLHAVPFLYADFATEPARRIHVPPYEPTTAEERLAVALLRDAHRAGAGVALRYRPSPFWGVDVVTQVELA